jgi:SPX domain protein involved in polyphosphate accumulation
MHMSNYQHGAWRFEVKYRISIFDYHRLCIAIMPFMKRDFYTDRSSLKKYFVRSLYYDTYDYRLYNEKMSGDSERIKLRLRTYSKKISQQTVIRVELKVRKGNGMEKFGVSITPCEYLCFKKTGHWPSNLNPILQEYERHLHLWALKPQVLVEYVREGFEDRGREGVRITFDHKVCGAQADNLFPNSPPFFREFHPHNIVLEIKTKQNRPKWVHRLIHDYGLRWVANSKFAQGIQTARHDLCYPNGVVVVR